MPRIVEFASFSRIYSTYSRLSAKRDWAYGESNRLFNGISICPLCIQLPFRCVVHWNSFSSEIKERL